MLNIAFLDPVQWQYSVDAPYERPFGGSQSALCYLAVELASLGHRVTILNGNPAPIESRGVLLTSFSEIQSRGYLNNFDVVVAVNAAMGRWLRRDVGVSVPMILWMHHAHDQPAALELRRLSERKSWTGFAFVSNWQRENFEKVFWVPREKGRVLRNAVSPAFADQSITPPYQVSHQRCSIQARRFAVWTCCCRRFQ